MLSPRNHEEKSRHSRYRSCWWIQDHHIVAPSGQRSKGSFFFGKQNKTMPDKKHQTNDTSTKKTMITWPEEPTLKGIGNNSYRLHNRRSTKSGHKNYIWIHINIFSETYRKPGHSSGTYKCVLVTLLFNSSAFLCCPLSRAHFSKCV